jgi:hypothetical protein
MYVFLEEQAVFPMEPWNAGYREVQCGSTDLNFVLTIVIITELNPERWRNVLLKDPVRTEQ